MIVDTLAGSDVGLGDLVSTVHDGVRVLGRIVEPSPEVKIPYGALHLVKVYAEMKHGRWGKVAKTIWLAKTHDLRAWAKIVFEAGDRLYRWDVLKRQWVAAEVLDGLDIGDFYVPHPDTPIHPPTHKPRSRFKSSTLAFQLNLEKLK